MGHELDITDGVASFADSRDDAWHALGQSVGHAMTADEVLDEAHLRGWNVRKHRLHTENEDGDLMEIADRFATVRTNPINGATEYLGVVGPHWTPVQNEQSVDFLNALVDESGAHFETAGALRGGRETFVTMKLPDYMDFEAPGGIIDRTEFYLAAINGHDGLSSFKVITTPVRIVCANTQSLALRTAKSSWAVRHCPSALKAIEEARTALRVAFAYRDAVSEELHKMIQVETDAEEAKRLLTEVFDVEGAGTERAADGRRVHVDNVLQLLDAPTQLGLGYTRYGIYNGVTEYMDHKVERNGGNFGAAPAARLFGAGMETKTRAFELLRIN